MGFLEQSVTLCIHLGGSVDGSSSRAPNGASEEKAMRAPTKENASLSLSILSLIISLVGAVLAGVQAQASLQQAEAAQADLTNAQRLFDEAGPGLRVSSSIVFYDGPETAGRQLSFPDSGGQMPLNSTLLRSYRFAQLRIQIENEGRESTTINDVTLHLGGTWGDRRIALFPSPGESFFCDERPYDQDICRNKIPYVLEPGRVLYVAFAGFATYYPRVLQERTCPNGIPIDIDAVAVQKRPYPYVAPARIS